MYHSLCVPLLAICMVFSLTTGTVTGQSSDGEPLRIIAFGAHPDDCELNAGGVGALWAEQGHAVKCVSMTNGDIGHFGMSGGALAIRRMAEVEAAAEVLGITTEVMDIHDGELVPSLENRKKVARLIREWQADIVMVHRRYDYHPDHRYSGVLVDDATILVEAAFFTPDTPPLPRNPVVLYHHDRFEKPYPHDPIIAVSIDEVADRKWRALEEMPSQFSDVDSWAWGRNDNVPEDEGERMRIRLEGFKQRNVNQANQYRDLLIELYGEERGSAVEFAEAFELSQYGRQVTVDELKEMFPTFD